MGIKLGIIGVTGAVGKEMLKILEERKINIDEIRLFASFKSKGKKINFNNKEIEIDVVKEDSFKDLDFVLGATSSALALEYAPLIKKSNAIFIDNSSAFRMMDDVPLVIPSINANDAYQNKGIIANPNCSSIIALSAMNPINKLSKIKSVIATTYQAVSGAGIMGIKELEEQNKGIIEPNVFKYQIAYNVLPMIGDGLDNDYTSEEMKMQNEGRKIMHLKDLLIDCTCVRVPVLRSHSISLVVNTEDVIDIENLKREIIKDKTLILKDNLKESIYPMPISVSDKDEIEVGRIRKSLIDDHQITLFCSGDQIRKGAASNAIDIMELLIKNR